MTPLGKHHRPRWLQHQLLGGRERSGRQMRSHLFWGMEAVIVILEELGGERHLG